MTHTSRSAIETRRLCEQKRFNNYHRVMPGTLIGATKGIVPLVPITPKSNIPKLRGSILHEVAEKMFKQEEWRAWLENACLQFDPAIRQEQHTLIRRAMLGWQQVRGEILSDYTIMSAEAEWSWELTKSVSVSLRMDRILRHQLSTLAILDFKTMKAPDKNWNERMLNSSQTHLYIQALKERTGEFVSGIIYEGIIVGSLGEDLRQKSPFVRGYQKKSGEVVPGYLSGAPIIDTTSWHDDYWLGWATESGVLQGLYCTTGPCLPPQNTLLATKTRTAASEERWAERVSAIQEIGTTHGYDSLDYESAIEANIEQSPDACLKFGWEYACPYVGLCWGGQQPDEESFEPRVDHHATPE